MPRPVTIEPKGRTTKPGTNNNYNKYFPSMLDWEKQKNLECSSCFSSRAYCRNQLRDSRDLSLVGDGLTPCHYFRARPHGAAPHRTALLRTALAATRAVRRLTAPLRRRNRLRLRQATRSGRLVCLAPLSGAPAVRRRSGAGRTVWHTIHFYM